MYKRQAGNDGDTVTHYPAALDNVIAVAATNNLDQRASFSTYGDWVHIAAPGENILSTFFGSSSDYVYESGTSMACPFAASVAGLMIGRNPTITNVQVRDIIFNTCDNVGTFIQKGRVNAFKACQQVIQPVPFSATPITLQVGVIGGATEGTELTNYGNSSLNAGSIKSLDGIEYGIASINRAKLGAMATADAYVQIAPQVSNLLSANLVISARAAAGTSGLIFLFNNTTATWDQFGSMALNTTKKTSTLTIPIDKIQNYLNGSNMARIMIRGILPARSGASPSYNLYIDQMNVTGTSKSGA